MIRRLILPFALALGATAPGFAKPATEPIAPMTAAEESDVLLALNRAQLLHAYDQAAWHTTDTLVGDLSNDLLATIRGWIVTPEGADYRVTYYSGDPGTEHRPVYSAVWTDGSAVRDRRTHKPDDLLSAEETRLAAASDAVPEEGPMRCANRRFNRVVLPRTSDDGTDLVYLLTPQTETDSIPLGGHHRAEVKDGKLLAQRPFSNSCLDMPVKGEDEALFVTHLLDPTPTEVHLFSVFAAKKPIYVMTTTNDRIWAGEISEGRASVRLIQ